jgi:hypothetical protein
MYTSTPLVCVQGTDREESSFLLAAYEKPGFSDVSTKIRHILSQLHFTFKYLISLLFSFQGH